MVLAVPLLGAFYTLIFRPFIAILICVRPHTLETLATYGDSGHL